jgi:hypothetical protein
LSHWYTLLGSVRCNDDPSNGARGRGDTLVISDYPRDFSAELLSRREVYGVERPVIGPSTTRTMRVSCGRSDGHTEQTSGIEHPLVVGDKPSKTAAQQPRRSQVDSVERSQCGRG